MINLIREEGKILFSVVVADNKSDIELLYELMDKVSLKISLLEEAFSKGIESREEEFIQYAIEFIQKYTDPKGALRHFLKYCNKYCNNTFARKYDFFYRDESIRLKRTYYLSFAKGCSIFGEINKNKLYLGYAINLCILVYNRKDIGNYKFLDQAFHCIDILKNLEPNNIDNYTRKAYILLTKLKYVHPHYCHDAIQDIEYARQLFPNENMNLLKFKARVKANLVKGKLAVGKPSEREKDWRKLGNIFSADVAYDEVREILSKLDIKQNRQKLALAFRKAGYKQIVQSDFEGAELTKLDRKVLEQTYGIRVYPITIIVSADKWKYLKGKDLEGLYKKLNVEDWVGGVNLSAKMFPYPFNQLGGIRLLAEDYYDPHEDLHGSFDIYQLSTHPIIDELFAFSWNVKEGKSTWYSVKDLLIEGYITHYYPSIKEQERIDLEKEIELACQTMAIMQVLWDEKKISKVLMKSQSLSELNMWHQTLKEKYDKFLEEVAEDRKYIKNLFSDLDNKRSREKIVKFFRDIAEHPYYKEDPHLKRISDMLKKIEEYDLIGASFIKIITPGGKYYNTSFKIGLRLTEIAKKRIWAISDPSIIIVGGSIQFKEKPFSSIKVFSLEVPP